MYTATTFLLLILIAVYSVYLGARPVQRSSETSTQQVPKQQAHATTTPNTPSVSGAYLKIVTKNQDGTQLRDGVFVMNVKYPEDPGIPPWSYERDLGQINANNGLVSFVPIPSTGHQLTIFYVLSKTGQKSDEWEIDNRSYWSDYETAKLKRTPYVYEHVFILQ